MLWTYVASAGHFVGGDMVCGPAEASRDGSAGAAPRRSDRDGCRLPAVLERAVVASALPKLGASRGNGEQAGAKKTGTEK